MSFALKPYEANEVSEENELNELHSLASGELSTRVLLPWFIECMLQAGNWIWAWKGVAVMGEGKGSGRCSRQVVPTLK